MTKSRSASIVESNRWGSPRPDTCGRCRATGARQTGGARSWRSQQIHSDRTADQGQAIPSNRPRSRAETLRPLGGEISPSLPKPRPGFGEDRLGRPSFNFAGSTLLRHVFSPRRPKPASPPSAEPPTMPQSSHKDSPAPLGATLGRPSKSARQSLLPPGENQRRL